MIQLYALLVADKQSFASLLSVGVSFATISFGCTNICFDFDLSTDFRRLSPEFHGYVPSSSGKRTLVFIAMLLFTFCHIGVRLIGISVLAVVSPTVAAAVLGGDVVFFFLFKIARRDLRYWLNVEGYTSWVVTFISRLFEKLMVDFTAMVQLRRKCIACCLSSF